MIFSASRRSSSVIFCGEKSKWFCKKADRVICCSERICREVEEKYGCTRAVTLHNPFDMREIESLAGQEAAEAVSDIGPFFFLELMNLTGPPDHIPQLCKLSGPARKMQVDHLEPTESLAGQEAAALPWEEGRILVSMGREDSVKGFWHLLKSFAIIHEALPDTKLMIIGQGEYVQYKELAQNHLICPRLSMSI